MKVTEIHLLSIENLLSLNLPLLFPFLHVPLIYCTNHPFPLNPLVFLRNIFGLYEVDHACGFLFFEGPLEYALVPGLEFQML